MKSTQTLFNTYCMGACQQGEEREAAASEVTHGQGHSETAVWPGLENSIKCQLHDSASMPWMAALEDSYGCHRETVTIVTGPFHCPQQNTHSAYYSWAVEYYKVWKGDKEKLQVFTDTPCFQCCERHSQHVPLHQF